MWCVSVFTDRKNQEGLAMCSGVLCEWEFSVLGVANYLGLYTVAERWCAAGGNSRSPFADVLCPSSYSVN